MESFHQSGPFAPIPFDDPEKDESLVSWEFDLDPSSPFNRFRIGYGGNQFLDVSSGVYSLDVPDGVFRFLGIFQEQISAEVPLNLAGEGYPAPARVNNTSRLAERGEGGGTEYLLSWNAFEGGTTNDIVIVSPNSLRFGADWASALTPPGRTNGIDGTATAAIIPMGLEFTNQVVVTFLKVSDRQTNATGQLIGIAGYASQSIVGFSSGASSTPGSNPPPSLIYSWPENGATNTPTREAVRFDFDQPMLEGVLISWSTNLDSTKWTYKWDRDDRRQSLHCTYAGRLPGSELIHWTLNPGGVAGARFAGTNGIPLPDDLFSGSFRTISVGATNIWYTGLFSSRSFVQEGLGEPNEEPGFFNFLSFFAGLRGEPLTTATATLRFPDGTDVKSSANGTLGYDNFDWEFEELATVQELYPDGEYLVSYEFGDGSHVSAGFKFDLGAELTPPRIENLQEAQAIDSEREFVLRWSAGSGDDYDIRQTLSLDRDAILINPADGNEGPLDFCVRGGYGFIEILRKDRQLILPAGSLLPGATYKCALTLVREVMIESSTPGSVPDYEGAFWDTEHQLLFTIRTLGSGCPSRRVDVISESISVDVDQSISRPLRATGGTAPYHWQLLQGSSLPSGVTLTPEGRVVGTPLEKGTFNFAARVYDSASKEFDSETGNTGTAVFRIQVGTANPVTAPELAVIPSAAGERLAFSFPTEPGRIYRIQGAQQLGAWATLESVIGTGARREYRVRATGGDTHQFYRVWLP